MKKLATTVGTPIVLTSDTPATFVVPEMGRFSRVVSIDVEYDEPGVYVISVEPGEDIELTVAGDTVPQDAQQAAFHAAWLASRQAARDGNKRKLQGGQ